MCMMKSFVRRDVIFPTLTDMTHYFYVYNVAKTIRRCRDICET